jgi:hypothetical protein
MFPKLKNASGYAQSLHAVDRITITIQGIVRLAKSILHTFPMVDVRRRSSFPTLPVRYGIQVGWISSQALVPDIIP